MTEIYPTRVRAIGASISRVWYGFATILSPVAIGFIIHRFGFFYVPLILAGLSMALGIVTALFAVETKGRVLEDVAP
jgi:putative MFS transporter